MAMTSLLKGTNPGFQSHFWMELQIKDKQMPIIGHLHYRP